MSTDTYMPPAAYTPGTQPPPSEGSWVKPVLVAIGSVVLTLAAAQAVVNGIRIFNASESTETASMAGVTTLDIELSSGDFVIAYDAIDEAKLTATGIKNWELTRDGNTLKVDTEWSLFGGGCLGWCFGAHESVILTLPAEYQHQALDAEVEVSAGDFVSQQDFGSLRVHVSAGSAQLKGKAEHVRADVSAGRVDADFTDVATATFDISAGKIDATLLGSAPDEIKIDVSAGSLDLAVPTGPYAVTSDVSAGSFDNQVESSSTAARTIDVQVSAGSVELRSSR